MMDRAARRAQQYMIVAFVGFTLFGVGLGFYATPSTDAALSNVPGDKAGTASGIYKMASSLGAALGVAISAVLFTALSGLESQSGPPSDLFPRKDRQDRHPVRSRDRAAVQRADGRRRDHRYRFDRAQG